MTKLARRQLTSLFHDLADEIETFLTKLEEDEVSSRNEKNRRHTRTGGTGVREDSGSIKEGQDS